jgi:hypothetical protein
MLNQNYNKMKLARQFIIQIIATGLAILFTYCFWGCASTGTQQTDNSATVQDTVNNEYNIEDLNTYGEWVYLDRFGRVWRPSVIDTWQPFYYGDWLYTTDGWAWDSYEPYGWIVYHYGNWYYDPVNRWVWIPGHQWSPARVRWITYGDYIGWAPIPPQGIFWRDPWLDSDYPVWNVVVITDFTRERVGQYRIKHPRQRDERDARRNMNEPPNLKLIEERTHQPVRVVRVKREPVSTGNRQIHKMRLPDQENKRIQQHKPQVEREVLRPKVVNPTPQETKKREQTQSKKKTEKKETPTKKKNDKK